MYTKLGLYALLFESTAWATLLADPTGDLALAGFLLAHAVAAAALALLSTALLPAHLRQPRWALGALVFGACYALPVIGFVATLVGVLLLRTLPGYRPHDRFEPHELPKIDPQQRAGAGFRQSGLSAFLSNPAAPEASRLRALVALQAVPGHVAAPLLRGVLADRSEDLRLLAYGMLDRHEKRINDAIHRERTRFATAAESSPERLAATRQLADLYWELIYQELVSGDLLRHALAESLRFTEGALATRPDDPSMLLRRGRLLHLSGRDAEAAAAYDRALALGLPVTRITPYLAELAFTRGDYDEVRRQMGTLGPWRALPKLRPLIDFWQERAA
jgi:tetratricopeptide (TPR) repeat protein